MSEKNNANEAELGDVSFQPLPNIITAFSADASPFEALAESVDNSIDHVRSRAYEGEDPQDDLEISITFDVGPTPAESSIAIEDNAGGVSSENLSRFFQWGASVTAPESIGRFGVGASRIAALGERIIYQSRSQNQAVGYGFEVNVAEMENHEGDVTEDTYTANRETVEDLEEGHTRVIIRDLKRSVPEILGIDTNSAVDEEQQILNDNVAEEEWQTAIEKFAKQFGDYFERYITEGVQFDAEYFRTSTKQIDVSIDVHLEDNGVSLTEEASPPREIDYSYLPFDSLGPRRYEGVPFDQDDETAPENASIRADIEVGLMCKADRDQSGLTILANNRKILSRDTSNPLFSSDYLGRFRSESGHARLVIEVSLRGETEEMPINSLKSDLDMNSPVAEPLLRIVKNAAKQYRKQTYSSMPDWILNVYNQEHSFAANNGEVAIFDKSDSTTNSARFRNQPGSSGKREFAERDRLRAIVKVHQALRISDESPLLPKEVAAYKRYFNSEYQEEVDDLEFASENPVETEGPELDWEEVSITADADKIYPVSTVIQMAKQHSKAGGRIDEGDVLESWKIPRYQEELRKRFGVQDLDEADIEVWDELPENVLIEGAVDLVDQLEWVPDKEDMDERGMYPSELYIERFGSWESVLVSIGAIDTPTEEETLTETDKTTTEKSTERTPADGQARSMSSVDSSGQSLDTTTESVDASTGSSERTTRTSSSVKGPGIATESGYYRIPEEDKELLEDVLGITEESDPEEAWKSLKAVLEWYQQVPTPE
ncbi:ATP-binding protein [Natronococcus sp. A-GB1]|uniref:ATP-binding protein n=1 Tax=Natronococcus sp. A-GB1 TaxID=3037648 RepID=UPI00241F0629|nr:ATP-binding protein [Natronococcus sp. A-GB1]MDG5761343.1 ATP-binding protein [Natronococcus sp. A-GB1]